MNTSEIMSAMIFGDGGASKVEELSTDGGSTDAGKVLVVGDNGKIAASDLSVGEGEVAIDKGLVVNGAAADAKVVGDAIASLNGSLDAVVVRNLAKNTTWSIGKAIQATTGTSYTSSGAAHTGFINISNCSRIMYMRRYLTLQYAPTSGMAFYDANKNYISGVSDAYKSSDTIPKMNIITVPENAVYARASYYPPDSDVFTNYPFFVYDADLYEAALETKVKQNTDDISAHYTELNGSLGMLKADLGDKIDLPSNGYGVSGKVLRSTGSGTEWASVGQPTDAQTSEAVSDWLDEHPEATTTVQDGSLTEAKFSNALKLKTINDYVTPEMFGAVGDGVADDTVAIQEAIDTGNTVIVSGKTYRITTKITNTNGISLKLLKNAVIKLDSAQVIDCMFELTHGYNGVAYNGRIEGEGVLDGSYKCKTLIGLNLFSSFIISGIFIRNFTEHGIESGYNDGSHSVTIGGGLTVSKVRIVNVGTPNQNAYGIYDNGNDNVYKDIIVQDCKYGFYCNNSMFQHCHHWISTSLLFEGSTSFYVGNKTAIISDVIVDTIQTAIEMANTSVAAAVVNGLEVYTNRNVINAEVGNQYGFTVFKPNTLAMMRVSDIILMFSASYTNVKFVPDEFYANGNYVTRFKYDNVVYDTAPQNFGDRVFSGKQLGSVTSLDNIPVGFHSAYCNTDASTGMVGGWSIIGIYPMSNTAASIDAEANAIIFNLTNNTMYHALKRNGTWEKIS